MLKLEARALGHEQDGAQVKLVSLPAPFEDEAVAGIRELEPAPLHAPHVT